ncbi:MAG: glycosyltransferase [Clostridia bacterium]|nr:glycosyltransferase [Clostridia bacterium]
MKKILIVSHAMELGGAERALLGLLNNIDYSRFSVDLFLERHTGELFDFIPDKVKILPENSAYACMAVPASQVIKKMKFGVAFGRYLGKKKADEFIIQNGIKDGADVLINYSQKYTVKFMPMISDEEYDLVISFLTPHYFAAQKVKGKVKIAWIHTDYSAVEIDRHSELEMWSAYDRIISISQEVTHSFLKALPELKDKITVIPNMHPAEFIKAKSTEFEPHKEMPRTGAINLLSIGRFCPAKNFDNLPFICKQLIEKYKLNVKWYVIGYGTDTELIKANIQKAGMEDNVIILGKKENPYPYIKWCDYYIQPSRYEGNAVTVNEALILQKLVVITDYSTSAGQINNGVDGAIVPLSNDLCAKGIADFINNAQLQQKIRTNLSSADFSNAEKVTDLYKLMR